MSYAVISPFRIGYQVGYCGKQEEKNGYKPLYYIAILM